MGKEEAETGGKFPSVSWARRRDPLRGSRKWLAIVYEADRPSKSSFGQMKNAKLSWLVILWLVPHISLYFYYYYYLKYVDPPTE